ncbi:YfkD family protein [Salsuginibacillus kocurii]|uniref:YfkD family protein n=1 Tax=Salsuginibacillus kocurii TaxID=427078 RepID=UPI0003621626|nr:YfkD family protein [Salsuginibacillus kocurii]
MKYTFRCKLLALLFLGLIVCMLDGTMNVSLAEEAEETIEVPDYVYDVSNENTVRNGGENPSYEEPSEFTRELLEDSEQVIQNPELVRVLNRSSVSPWPVSFGQRASIYLGSWPVAYESNQRSVNWEYEQINQNPLDNRGGQAAKELTYKQQETKTVNGGLTTAHENKHVVEYMMRKQAKKDTKLPLVSEASIGEGTAKNHPYAVGAKQLGNLTGYMPALHESGELIHGDVYMNISGKEANLEIRNITKQETEAWFLLKDQVALKFNTHE